MEDTISHGMKKRIGAGVRGDEGPGYEGMRVGVRRDKVPGYEGIRVRGTRELEPGYEGIRTGVREY